MAVALDQFAKSLTAGGIMPAEGVKAFFEALPADQRPRDGEAFAKALIDAGKITEFQAQHLLAGRAAALMVGEYLLTDRIGAGGMGQVFKARHLRMQRTVALKMMSPQAMKDEASVRRFQREVRAAARLEHQNIVTAYDAGQAGKTHFLVMQYVDGGDLAQWVKDKGPLSIGQACDFVAQAARGLAYAHSEGVIHRDIKPANLLIDKKGAVKILDMGLARVAEGNDELTGSEQVMGTVDYMSPEQASESKQADARSDIYSLGCTLWFLLTGKRLFEAESMIARLVKHRDEAPPSLVQIRGDAPWSLEQTLHKMVAKRPEDRFASMDEVAAALEPSATRGGAVGEGSSVLRNAELASFLHGMGSQVGGASKAGGGSSGSLRPSSSGVLRPGSAADILPPAVGPDAGGSRSGTRPPSSVHAVTAAVSGSGFDTDPALAKKGSPSSGVGRKSSTATYAPAKKQKSPLPLIIAGGVGVLVVIIAVAMMSRKPQSKEVAAAAAGGVSEPSAPAAAPTGSFGSFAKTAPVIDYQAERRAAEWAIGKGGMAGVAYGNDAVVEYRERRLLPAGQWTVRRISLSDRRNTGDGELTLLLPLAELESLNLNNAGVTFKCLPYVGRLKTLKSLELNNANVRDADVDYLAGLTSLTGLGLQGSSVSEDGIAKLTKLPLKRLELGSIVAGNKLGKVLREFTQLTTLRLSAVGLHDDGLAELAVLTNLMTFSLHGVPIGDASLKHIAGWKSLRDVTIGGGSITPAGLSAVASMTFLRRFELEGYGDVQNEMAALQKALPATEIWLNNVRVAPREFPLPSEPTPAVPHNSLSAEEQATGWKLLFDGKSFAGWKAFRGTIGGWWVVDGQLRTDGGGPYLSTDQDYAHFELMFDVRFASGANSGLYYHVDEAIDPPGKTGPEMELTRDGRLGTIWAIGPQDNGNKLDSPEWFRVKVTAAPGGAKHEVFAPDGRRLWERSYSRNSQEVVNSQPFRDSPNFWKNDFGRIVFQSRDSSVAIRNVKLRVLEAAAATKLIEGTP